MKEIRTETLINAKPEVVWRILTDFYKYPDWNQFITSIEGRPEAGTELNVTMIRGSGKKRRSKPEVIAFEPEKEFRWKGKSKAGWLFSGEHYFIVEEETADRTRLVHGEIFTGFLVPMLWRSLNTDTRRGFMEFNKALKRKAESAS